MSIQEESLQLHEKLRGKIEVHSKAAVNSKEDLSLLYSPGVAEPCRKIAENVEDVWKYTSRRNLVAVVSDGTAVLGLGDIGPEAAMPVMEGKAILFKEFGDVDAFPICVRTKEVDEIVQLVKWLEPTFGGVNLEDISAPRCFEIEERLKAELSIPVFHDDQHGTAIVTLAGLMNAFELTGRNFEDARFVINGVGAAGVAITKILMTQGARNILCVDSTGIIVKGRENLNWMKEELAETTNPENVGGSLADAMKGADVFIGVSVAGAVTQDMVRSMNADPIIFAMANPTPEILPEQAREAGAAIVATGRSDYPNQVNNVLVFPGLFRGVLDAETAEITDAMKLAAARALADYVSEPTPEMIIPNPLDKGAAKAVAEAVKSAI